MKFNRTIGVAVKFLAYISVVVAMLGAVGYGVFMLDALADNHGREAAEMAR